MKTTKVFHEFFTLFSQKNDVKEIYDFKKRKEREIEMHFEVRIAQNVFHVAWVLCQSAQREFTSRISSVVKVKIRNCC